MSIDLDRDNYKENAELLLQGMWYAELPDIIDLEELFGGVGAITEALNEKQFDCYQYDEDGFISEWKNIQSPPTVYKPGVEAITFFDFKKNGSLREMQIPNLLHYIAFIYNTLFVFESLFRSLYLDEANSIYIENSNSGLVFKNFFVITNYLGEEELGIKGKFATKNNKINSSILLSHNKSRVLDAEQAYLYSLKVDIESFFPNLYTHYFEKIAKRVPFAHIVEDGRYFSFLDRFHQRINNNQTKGIPAGVFSSHVAAELCMLCVDEEIRNYIKNENISMGYLRYVDDLTFYSDSESELKAVHLKAQSILNKYRLRINGNKTENIHNTFSLQPSYITEVERQFPILCISDDVESLSFPTLLEMRKYISDCLLKKRSSQVRALLTRLYNRIRNGKLVAPFIEDKLFFFLLKLPFEDPTLVYCVFHLLDQILSQETYQKEKMLEALYKKREIIDREYSDTLLQIWYYYIVFQHAPEEYKRAFVSDLSGKAYNPIIISAMVSIGDNTNKSLFKYIRDTYIKESGSTEWRKEIIYSRWWLPLFKILRYDAANYDSFMASANIPDVFRMFPRHNVKDIDD